jgi:hypothetical protein
MATEPRNDHYSGPEDTQGQQGLFCVAVGTDPAGRSRRIKIRRAGNSFTMTDDRRRCRINAHWSRQLTEEDIVGEVWFVFRVRVDALELLSAPQAPLMSREPKARPCKSWGRKISLAQLAGAPSVASSQAPHYGESSRPPNQTIFAGGKTELQCRIDGSA